MILKDEFQIEVELRDDRLCPTIPSRLRYLEIISQILEECGLNNNNNNNDVKGLDIGTGAYAIYAILGFKKHGWSMIGTDIDQESINHAQHIITTNQLNKIKILNVVNDPNEFFPQGESFTFTMCNPPFFKSRDEMLRNSSFKEKLNRGSVVASDDELITENGEVGFVTNMIKESLNHQESIIWFSSLLGKKNSIDSVINVLQNVNCENFFIRDYQLGNTKRWIIFWSFKLYRPMIKNDYKKIESTIVEFKIDLKKVEVILKELPLTLEFKQFNDKDEIIVVTNGDVWSRSFRRKKQKPNIQQKSIFKITSNEIYFHYGPSFKIFQSFQTFIRKHL